MKTECHYNPASSSLSSGSGAQPHITSSQTSSSVSAAAALCELTSSSFPLSVSPADHQRDTLVTGTMGLQPHGLHPQRGHLPPYMRPHSPEGLPPHHQRGGGGGAHCGCQCPHLPQDRTILHSILTGQGYKFGYGSGASYGVSSSSPFFQTLGHYHASASGDQDGTDDLLLDLHPLDSK